MLRLAVVTTHPIQYYAPLFRTLAERGNVDVRVFYEWEGGSQAPTLDRDFGQAVQWDVPLLDGYPHEFVPNRSPDPGTHHFRGLDNPALVPRILAYRPSAVLMFGWNYASHLRALRAFRGRVPVLFRGDSTLLDEVPGLRRIARRAWLRYVYRHVDTAVFVGRHNRDYFAAHGLRDEQLVWGPHAVDNARFADPDGVKEADARRWRASLGIPDGAPTFVFAGKLDENKQPDRLLDAFLALGDSPAHLVFVGSGPLEGDLRARAAPGRVHFVGFQNQSRMPVAYRLGDVLVLPSRKETWGLAVNEAMASGRSVVVSDGVGCAPDLVVEGKTGTVVASGRVGPLREALDAFVTDPGRAARLGRASAAHIAAWNLGTLAEQIETSTLRAAPHTASTLSRFPRLR